MAKTYGYAYEEKREISGNHHGSKNSLYASEQDETQVDQKNFVRGRGNRRDRLGNKIRLGRCHSFYGIIFIGGDGPLIKNGLYLNSHIHSLGGNILDVSIHP